MPVSPEAAFHSFHKPKQEFFFRKKDTWLLCPPPRPHSLGLLGGIHRGHNGGVWIEEWDNFISAWTVLGAVHWISYGNCQVPPTWIPAKAIGYACTAIHSPEYFAVRPQILCLLVDSGALTGCFITTGAVRDIVVVPHARRVTPISRPDSL